MTEIPTPNTFDGVVIRVSGQVQGVGFRPFIWTLAQRFQVKGEVLNDPSGVVIRAIGASDAFLAAIREEAPPLARVDAVEVHPHRVSVTPKGFEIKASEGVGAQTRVTPDAATYDAYVAEITTPSERRFGYPFANCTNCGPRVSILDGLPYDRARTSMAAFEMCPECRAEYDDPGDRRFHAQPVACPACGPRAWIELDGRALSDDPIPPRRVSPRL